MCDGQTVVNETFPGQLTEHIDTNVYNAITATISQGHFELYKYMKNQHSKGLKIERWKIEEIWRNFIRKPYKRIMYKSDITKREDSKALSMAWFRIAITHLCVKGYCGLTFKREVV